VSQNPAPAGAPAPSQLARSPAKIEAIGIVIPATNQSATIGKCIASLFAANSYCGWRNSLWIVVIADACTDDTVKTARDALGAFGQVLEICARSRQAAHELGADIILDHFRDVPRHRLFLASTDASADLPPDWVNRQIKSSQSPVGLAANY
jgi:hypothetical protein